MTACVLENLTTGESMSFGATVNIADILKIDSDQQSVENDNVDSIANFTGDFLRLVPGNNQLRFTGTTGGTLLVDWYEKYLFG
jgi:phage-related protein